MSTSKTGKHGHAKVHLVAIDVCLFRLIRSDEYLLSGFFDQIFTGKKLVRSLEQLNPRASVESRSSRFIGRHLPFHSQYGRPQRLPYRIPACMLPSKLVRLGR